MNIEDQVQKLTLEEKASLGSGADAWTTRAGGPARYTLGCRRRRTPRCAQANPRGRTHP